MPDKTIEAFIHDEAHRTNIPTAEYEPLVDEELKAPKELRYPRNTDLDPQLVWRGKDEQDWSDLVVQAPPLYIQEKIHPKVLIDDLVRQSRRNGGSKEGDQFDFFADFNGIPGEAAKTEFYQHEANWTNRMILGDSLQVMASLAEREGLRGKVQCIYIDPPYGIKFNSNFQWSTTSRDVKDGNAAHITREPEQVKAFRDTWRDGIHSYLTYLRDRLTAARDLLVDSGSIFVQIGDENVHRVRALMDEVFGEANLCSVITFRKTSSANSPQAAVNVLASVTDYILWYAKDLRAIKYRQPYVRKEFSGEGGGQYRWIQEPVGPPRSMSSSDDEHIDDLLAAGAKVLRPDTLSSTGYSEALSMPFEYRGRAFRVPPNTHWKTTANGLGALARSDRIIPIGQRLYYKRFIDDFAVFPLTNIWTDVGSSGFADPRMYVVQTVSHVVERCILMTTDPGDLVLDPTCGSGTTAYVAEQWGRRWTTIDTSRVALALARARVMGARYPYYVLADSSEGKRKEAQASRRDFVDTPSYGSLRHGFVYERVPHITLRDIANNAEIDVIYEDWQPKVLGALERLNTTLRGHAKPFRVTTGGRQGKDIRLDAPNEATFAMPSGEVVKAYELVEWEVPREAPQDWPEAARGPLADFWEARIGRQKEIDASIAAHAEFEYLYDRPYEDRTKVRVAGPFTVESLSPHRVLGVDEDDELFEQFKEEGIEYDAPPSFVDVILDQLKTAGVQQAHKEDRIAFTSLAPWPGAYVCAEGRYLEGHNGAGTERRAAIFVGPEFGTVTRPDLVAAAREAADAGFDVLIGCAFNYDAHTSEFERLGRVPVLKARMNADLHMAQDLKATAKGNLFVIFGEPDIDILDAGEDGEPGQVRVKVNGVDVFHPQTGEVRSDGPEGIACWFIDTDYDEESFFVRHAYFLGANDPYRSLKTTLRAEINEEAWESLHSDTSRPFDKPTSGRIAVKVINHLGDEVMKVFRVE